MRKERENKPKIVKSVPRVEKKVVQKPSKVINKKIGESETEKLKRERDEALRVLQQKEMEEEKKRLIRERDEALKKIKEMEEREARLKNAKPVVKNEVKKKIEPSKQFPPKHVRRPEAGKAVREFPPKDVARPKSLPKKRKWLSNFLKNLVKLKCKLENR